MISLPTHASQDKFAPTPQTTTPRIHIISITPPLVSKRAYFAYFGYSYYQKGTLYV